MNSPLQPAPLGPLATPAPDAAYLQDLQTRLLAAVSNVRQTGTSDQNKMIDFLLNQAQGQTVDLLNGNSTSSPVHTILANVKSLLMHATVLPTSTGGIAVSTISDEGDLVGKAPYESLDIKWTEAAVCWLENFPPAKKAPFRTQPPTITMDAQVSIAVAGDWGTGTTYRTDGLPAPAAKVATQINNRTPEYTVHLGDVYYAGTTSEEQNNFLGIWPSGSIGSFTLNSNHEMYSGANGYFLALQDDQFKLQGQNSYFVMQNDDWFVIALDTAYHADELHLYQDGNLDQSQLDFIDGLIAGDTRNRRTILLTHHDGLAIDGAKRTALWGQIAQHFANRELWWYWGHMHAGVVYADRDNVHPRCCGHGAVPAGEPDALVGNPSAIWHENRTVTDLLYSGRVHNGFVMLGLNGPTLTETFVDEDGLEVYTQTYGPTATAATINAG